MPKIGLVYFPCLCPPFWLTSFGTTPLFADRDLVMIASSLSVLAALVIMVAAGYYRR